MKLMVSICSLFTFLFLQSCGEKSKSGAVMSLYQSEHVASNKLEKDQNTNDEAKDEQSQLTLKLDLIWDKEWRDSAVKNFQVDRFYSFSLPSKIESLNRDAFPGIITLDLFRPKSETSLPKKLRCIYRQKENDRDFDFQFCVELDTPIAVGKLEKIKASAMNLIKESQRALINFELTEGDKISVSMTYPLSIEKQGKTKSIFKANTELLLLK